MSSTTLVFETTKPLHPLSRIDRPLKKVVITIELKGVHIYFTMTWESFDGFIGSKTTKQIRPHSFRTPGLLRRGKQTLRKNYHHEGANSLRLVE